MIVWRFVRRLELVFWRDVFVGVMVRSGCNFLALIKGGHRSISHCLSPYCR